jgi:hypothetical protein
LEEHPNGSLTWGPIGNASADFFRQVGSQEAAGRFEEEALGDIGRAARDVPNPDRPNVSGSLRPAMPYKGNRLIRGEADPSKEPPLAFKKFVQKVGKTIDNVHTDGDLKMLPITNGGQSRGSLGTFWSRMGQPRSIGIKTGAEGRESTLAHEIGHWLDYAGIPRAAELDRLGMSYDTATAMGEKGPLKEVMAAIKDSQAFKDLKAHSADRAYSSGGYFKYLQYLTSSKELWARAYAQYIAEESGDAAMLAEINVGVVSGTREYLPVATQWTKEDFAPIRAAISRVFRDLGWRVSAKA